MIYYYALILSKSKLFRRFHILIHGRSYIDIIHVIYYYKFSCFIGRHQSRQHNIKSVYYALCIPTYIAVIAARTSFMFYRRFRRLNINPCNKLY